MWRAKSGREPLSAKLSLTNFFRRRVLSQWHRLGSAALLFLLMRGGCGRYLGLIFVRHGHFAPANPLLMFFRRTFGHKWRRGVCGGCRRNYWLVEKRWDTGRFAKRWPNI